MKKRFKYMLAREISKAVIKCIKARKFNEYDNESSGEALQGVFKRLSDHDFYKMTDSEILAEFENALNHAKGK